MSKYSIRNCVEKTLCAIGCVGVVLLALAWAFYVARRCKQVHIQNHNYSLRADPIISLLCLSTILVMWFLTIVLYTDNEKILWEILLGITAVASAGLCWKTFVITFTLIWWCTLRSKFDLCYTCSWQFTCRCTGIIIAYGHLCMVIY